jgi:GDPmannose 4,6-dehydratase/GDP-4-dehydro-6-deoxy-D-mannose reductase
LESLFHKALITGVSGSGGSYLADHIVQNYPSVEVHGVSRWHSSTASNNNLRLAGDRVRRHECDLQDLGSLIAVLKETEPDVIFHLASHANVRASFVTPLSVLHNNIMGTANLFEALRILALDPVIQLCSTSEVYGQVDPKEVPIKESCPLRPASPYAISKVTQDLLGEVYFKAYDLKIIRTRMFAYLNPRRSDLFATAFAMQIARIEAGLQKELVHGNLNSTRTLIDVRDAMESYWVAAQKCEPGEAYNIGGATVITVGEVLEVLKSYATCKISSRLDATLLRPTDVTLQIPDTSKFAAATGWAPKYSFKDSIQHLLKHCREEAKIEANRAPGPG